MKNIFILLFSLAAILSFFGCAENANPEFRVHNERSSKANIQIQTSGGNTVNLNDVQPGQATAYQSAAVGIITATAVIQNEPVSPTITFNAGPDEKITIVIQMTTPPSLRIDR